MISQLPSDKIINFNKGNGSPIAEGGEGIIYKVDNNVYKIFKDRNKSKENKVCNLINLNLPSNIIKPEKAIVNNNHFIGYSMKYVKAVNIKNLSNKKYILSNNITIKNIGKLIIEMREVLNNIHNNNLIIGDFNDNNILVDEFLNHYYIDVDSWTVGKDECLVGMDGFVDPNFSGHFIKENDYYSFAIIAFKTFSRIHPFGGIMNPDINLLDRMKKGISVIDNDKVTVAKTIGSWKMISPYLLKDFKTIFESNKRFLLKESLDEFVGKIIKCTTHNDYYYKDYSNCPICCTGATLIQKTETHIPYRVIFTKDNIKIILDNNVYLNTNNIIQSFDGSILIKKDPSINKYYISNNNKVICFTDYDNIFIENNKTKYVIPKMHNSIIEFKDHFIYYIDENYNFVKVELHDFGNKFTNISKVSVRNIFSVNIDSYFILNIYDENCIVEVGGYMETYKNITSSFIDWGIKYDEITKTWLLILKYANQKIKGYIFKLNKIDLEFNISNILYLNNICYNNGIIYYPQENKIIGLNPRSGGTKEFILNNIINEESTLYKKENKFIVFNEKEIIEIG